MAVSIASDWWQGALLDQSRCKVLERHVISAQPVQRLWPGANASFQALIGSSANKHIPSEQRATILSSFSFINLGGIAASVGHGSEASK